MSSTSQVTDTEEHCSVNGCHRTDLKGHRWCEKHYMYWWRHGITEQEPWIDEPLPISEAEAMWLAAVLDCEGWIGMNKSKRPHGSAWWGKLGVGNTNSKLTDRLKQLTNAGTVRFVKMNNHCKDQYHWTVNRQADIRNILVTVLPYLLLKREQAELVLSLPPKWAKNKEARIEVYNRCALLNKKGKH